MEQIKPYSRHSTKALSRLDGRCKDGRLMRDTRRELTEHIGGNPSVAQALIIEQACQLKLRITAMDRKFKETGLQTEHDSRTYLAWSASLARLLRDLGMRAAKPAAPTLADIMARRSA